MRKLLIVKIVTLILAFMVIGYAATSSAFSDAEAPLQQEILNPLTPTESIVKKYDEEVQSKSKVVSKVASPEEQEDELIIQPTCAATPGWEASFLVTYQRVPVSGAKMQANYMEVGITDDAGTVTFTIPYTQSLRLDIEYGELTGMLELDISEGLPG